MGLARITGARQHPERVGLEPGHQQRPAVAGRVDRFERAPRLARRLGLLAPAELIERELHARGSVRSAAALRGAAQHLVVPAARGRAIAGSRSGVGDEDAGQLADERHAMVAERLLGALGVFERAGDVAADGRQARPHQTPDVVEEGVRHDLGPREHAIEFAARHLPVAARGVDPGEQDGVEPLRHRVERHGSGALRHRERAAVAAGEIAALRERDVEAAALARIREHAAQRDQPAQHAQRVVAAQLREVDDTDHPGDRAFLRAVATRAVHLHCAFEIGERVLRSGPQRRDTAHREQRGRPIDQRHGHPIDPMVDALGAALARPGPRRLEQHAADRFPVFDLREASERALPVTAPPQDRTRAAQQCMTRFRRASAS